MLWSPQTLSVGVFAILASAVLVTGSTAQQDAADRQGMVGQIDAMLASAGGTSGVAALSPRVRAAMTEVPRHEFVPPEYRSTAYSNSPLPIGHGQTISQPLIVGLMTELLQLVKTDKVLEVGTGSGYQAAILSVLASEVYTIEIVPELGKMARANLERLGYRNVSTKIGDGYQGWAEHAPFDAIIVTAAPNHVPPPLIAQLRPGGRMVIPVGGFDQELLVFEKHADGTATSTTIAPVRFVPLIREQLCGSQCAALQHSALRKPTVRASRLLTIRAILGEPHEALAPVADSRVQEMSCTALAGDQMTHGGQKGFGMSKHGRSGRATRSPRFRFLQKLEAQNNDRKDRSCIKDPKQSVEELFHPRKPTRT